MMDYSHRLEQYREERDQLERRFILGALEVAEASKEDRQKFSIKCFEEAEIAEKEWLDRISKMQVQNQPPWHFRFAWNRLNQQVKFKIE